jgi:hypothetical protein
MKLVPATSNHSVTCHPPAQVLCNTQASLAFACKAVSCHAQDCSNTFRPQVVLVTFRPQVVLVTFRPQVVLVTFRPQVVLVTFRPHVVLVTFRPQVVLVTFKTLCMLLYRCQALASTPSWPWSEASCSLVMCLWASRLSRLCSCSTKAWCQLTSV